MHDHVHGVPCASGSLSTGSFKIKTAFKKNLSRIASAFLLAVLLMGSLSFMGALPKVSADSTDTSTADFATNFYVWAINGSVDTNTPVPIINTTAQTITWYTTITPSSGVSTIEITVPDSYMGLDVYEGATIKTGTANYTLSVPYLYNASSAPASDWGSLTLYKPTDSGGIVKRVQLTSNDSSATALTLVMRYAIAPAVGFDGVNDYVQFASSSPLQLTGGMQLQVFMNYPRVESGGVLNKNYQDEYTIRLSVSNYGSFYWGNGSGFIGYGMPSAFTGDMIASLSNWTWSRDNSSLVVRSYVNNVLRGNQNYTQTITSSTSPVQVGLYSATYLEASIYNMTLFNSSDTSGTAELILNASSFSGTSNATVIDKSTNAASGTAYGNAQYKTYTGNGFQFTESGAYTLTVTAPSNGNLNVTTGAYSLGASVPVLATANSGYQFVAINVDGVNYTSNPLTITMSQNHVITAYFSAIFSAWSPFDEECNAYNTALWATLYSAPVSNGSVWNFSFATPTSGGIQANFKTMTGYGVYNVSMSLSQDRANTNYWIFLDRAFTNGSENNEIDLAEIVGGGSFNGYIDVSNWQNGTAYAHSNSSVWYYNNLTNVAGTGINICDGAFHNYWFNYTPTELTFYLDGNLMLDWQRDCNNKTLHPLALSPMTFMIGMKDNSTYGTPAIMLVDYIIYTPDPSVYLTLSTTGSGAGTVGFLNWQYNNNNGVMTSDSASGWYPLGTHIIATASPAFQSDFSNFTINGAATASNPAIFNLTANTTLVASFASQISNGSGGNGNGNGNGNGGGSANIPISAVNVNASSSVPPLAAAEQFFGSLPATLQRAAEMIAVLAVILIIAFVVVFASHSGESKGHSHRKSSKSRSSRKGRK